MKTITAHCGIGYPGAEIKDEIEADDNATKDQISQTVWEWATQYLETWWDE